MSVKEKKRKKRGGFVFERHPLIRQAIWLSDLKDLPSGLLGQHVSHSLGFGSPRFRSCPAEDSPAPPSTLPHTLDSASVLGINIESGTLTASSPSSKPTVARFSVSLQEKGFVTSFCPFPPFLPFILPIDVQVTFLSDGCCRGKEGYIKAERSASKSSWSFRGH